VCFMTRGTIWRYGALRAVMGLFATVVPTRHRFGAPRGNELAYAGRRGRMVSVAAMPRQARNMWALVHLRVGAKLSIFFFWADSWAHGRVLAERGINILQACKDTGTIPDGLM
jgi:hypothetical protein